MIRLLVGLSTPGFLAFALATACIAQSPAGLGARVPWTTSRVSGSPEPPLPYTTERGFTNLVLRAPLFLIEEPGTDHLVAITQGGEADRPSKLERFRNSPETSASSIWLAISNRLVYSLCFHPGYATNRHVFLFSNGPTGAGERTNRISRFTVSSDPLAPVPPASEHIVLEWRSAGHDGGGLGFGTDGMLYITSGDGTSDSDGWNSGQTLDDLLGGVLRIDVDHPSPGRKYSIPKDNPFVNVPGARGEIWAYGLRNPWRMSIDLPSGQIWVGNNGQDLWETAHLIRRGENYGWSVYEGSHPFYLGRKRGPTVHVFPTIEHSHSEFRSLTGGVVYRGRSFPELDGHYIYGDYSSGRIWAMKHDGTRPQRHLEIADTPLQIAAFCIDRHGNLWVVDHGTGFHRLQRAAPASSPSDFPRRLSETGLFISTRNHELHPGIVPYSVNSPAWSDGAEAERFIAIPDQQTASYDPGRSWIFPDGTVLLQTLHTGGGPGEDARRRRIESRLLLKQQGEWAGYSYRWTEDQSDATLVGRDGLDATTGTPGTARTGWRFPSRTECMTCHSRAANFVLGITEAQLNRDHAYGTLSTNQLHALAELRLFTNAPSTAPTVRPRLANPRDTAADLEARVRSYLHVNCAVCHVDAGGGNARMLLAIGTPRDQMNVLGARPQHDPLGIDNAMIVAPGDPQRSVLLQRLSRRGRGQMPPLVSTRVDDDAIELFRTWIAGLKPDRPFVRDWHTADFTPSSEDTRSPRSFSSGQRAFRDTGCIQCHKLSNDGGSVGPDLTGIGTRLKPDQILEAILEPSKTIAEEFTTHEIETRDGETHLGRIDREDARTVFLRPLSSSENPTEIPKHSIRIRRRSPGSPKPAGIVNTLQRNEILDLVAYLAANGEDPSPTSPPARPSQAP